MKVEKSNYFRRTVQYLLIFTLLVSGLLGAASGASAQSTNVIETKWSDHHVVVTDFDRENGVDWEELRDYLLEDKGIRSNPAIFEDASGTLWMCWDSSGSIFVSSSDDMDMGWKIQNVIKSYDQVLRSPYFYQGPDGSYWLSYVGEDVSGSPATSTFEPAENASGEMINKRIYVRNSEDGISWESPVQVSSDSSFDNANPWMVYGNGTYWIIFDSNRYGDNRELELASSADGLNWSEPISIIENPYGDDRDPAMTFYDGMFYLVWVSDHFEDFSKLVDIYDDMVAFSTSTNAVNWTTPEPVYPQKCRDSSPSLYKPPYGRLVLTWCSDRADYESAENMTDHDNDIWYSVFPDKDNGGWAVPSPLTSDQAFDSTPSIVQDRDENYWVVWERDDTIFYSQSSDIPLITDYIPKMQLSSSSWREEISSSYNAPVSKSFTIRNDGDRDLRGTIATSSGFTADRNEFLVPPNTEIVFKVTQESRTLGHYQGAIVIDSNDRNEPHISIPVDLLIISRSADKKIGVEDLIPGLPLLLPSLMDPSEDGGLSVLLCSIGIIVLLCAGLFVYAMMVRRRKYIKVRAHKRRKQKSGAAKKKDRKKEEGEPDEDEDFIDIASYRRRRPGTVKKEGEEDEGTKRDDGEDGDEVGDGSPADEVDDNEDKDGDKNGDEGPAAVKGDTGRKGKSGKGGRRSKRTRGSKPDDDEDMDEDTPDSKSDTKGKRRSARGGRKSKKNSEAGEGSKKSDGRPPDALLLFGSALCMMLMLLGGFVTPVTELASADNTERWGNDPRIVDQEVNEQWVWIPYYDVEGNTTEIQMGSECVSAYTGNEADKSDDFWCYGTSSDSNVKQLVESPLPVDRLRFWMNHSSGDGGSVCVRLSNDEGFVEWFWSDYLQGGWGWCEVDLEGSVLAGNSDGNRFHVQLTPPMDLSPTSGGAQPTPRIDDEGGRYITLLFLLSGDDYRQYLRLGPAAVPAELNDAFVGKDFILTEDATIRMDPERPDTWMISDGPDEYTIIDKRGDLRVYGSHETPSSRGPGRSGDGRTRSSVGSTHSNTIMGVNQKDPAIPFMQRPGKVQEIQYEVQYSQGMKNAYPGNPHPYRLRQYSGDSTNTVSDMDWVDDGYNIKMDLYIKAALLAYVGPPSLLETYQNNTDHDIPLEVNITNPFRNWRNFTVKVAVVAPNSTEETILEEELKLDHGESRTLDLSYSTEKGAIGGDYYVIAGIYLSGMNRNGSLVMVDKWGDTVGELCTSKFTLLNATPIVDVELVENTEWEQDPDKLHIYYIMCEDSPGLELAPKSTLTYRNEIRDKLDSFALASGVELVHRDITDTRELLELVGSDISDSMVINMHGGVLPIPHTFVKGDDPFEDTAALYHFDSTLADSSKNRNHGQFIGAPSWRFENGENRMGTSSLYLDGKDDLVKINHRYCLDLPSFTADFWLKLQKNYTSPEPHYIISYGEDTEGFHFSLNNSSASSPNALLFGIGSENTSMEIGGPSLEHDRWYRITGSYDGGNISLYVDNELENSSNTGEIVYGDGPMIIGGHLSGDSYGSRTEMIIDEFRITDDLHGLLRQLQGGKEDGFNWIKRVGKWIAEQGIVFVNPYGNPFSEAGISGMGLVGNSISLGDEGLSTLLKVRSHDGALPHSTGSTKTTITPEAKDIASGSPHLNAVFPKMMNGTARRRLSPDMASFSIPLYRETGTDAITNALMFYGKGAIMFNGLDLLNASVTAGVAFWYMVNNVRPLYFIDCEDAPKHDVTTPIIEDTMAALERMGNDTEVSFHKKIIGNTGDLERLVGSNLKEVMVINTHGEVLPIPISYTDRGSSDDENTAALYDFEDGGGNVIRDASGNHHEGAMRNAQWTTDSHFGKYAMEFSGDPAERIRISRARELAPDTFTLECSVYLKRDYVSGTDTPVAILSNEEQVGNGSGARTFGYGLTINRPTVDEGFPANLTNRVVFSVGTYGGARESIYPDTPLETGRWHRIAATYDGSQMRLYVNNEQAAAREVKFLFPASLNNLEIGASPLWGSGSNIDAIIDDVRISKNARPATESQLGTIAYEEWLGNISDWIADDGNIWISINGSQMQKLGLTEQGWPDDCAIIGGEGFYEFTGTRFPSFSLVDPQGGTGERSDIGDRIAAELPNASLPASVTGAASAIPSNSEMFTIPIYGNGSEVTHGVIPLGKGAFVHNGIFSLEIMAGTTAWLAAGGKPRMVYLIDVPVTTMREEVCIVDSQQRYREKTDSTWEIKRSGASRIRVHFEYVAADAEVLTGSGTSLLRYGALNSSVWSPWAEGEIIKVGPVPDSGTEEPDFRIDRIEYEEVMEEEGLEAVDPSEIKEELDILESGVGGECIYKTISSTGQLERLTMSRLERPLVINLRGSAIPVPSSYLDGRVTNHGETPPLGYLSGELYREYYGSYDLIGDRVIEMAPYIDVIKGDIRPKMSADTGPFGVRWRGKIKIEHDEEYTFHLMTGGGVRLRINGIPVIDEWALQPSGTPWTSVSGSIMLAPGFYDIEYEMHQQPGSSVARLEWESRSIERSFVPGTHLYSDYERPPLGYASNGLLGTYFATDNRTATEVTRVDPSVSFDWGAKSPMPSIPDNDFSVIWTGKLRVEEPGEHLFFTSKQAGDGCDLRVNGKEIDLDDDNAINFDAPGYYDIEFRYYEYSLNASVTLSWEQPTRAKEVIPSDHLFHPGGMLQYARGWLDDLGNWIGRNGVVFANTGGHPMKYAIVEGQETVDCWLIGEDGLGELLTPTAEKVQLIRNPNSSGILTITRTGREVNWITRNLKGFRNGTDLYLPSDYDCIPFYRDDDSNETAYGIIPLSRGGYVHCGGVSISALVAMCFMYTSRRSTMDQIEGRYQKGETVWAKVNIHNYFKSLRRYYFEIVVTYPEGGDDAKKIVDREACTLARDGSENIYLSWTPFKEDLAETYSLEIRAYDITTRFHSPLEIWGDELKEEIAVDVEVGAYITGVETSEYFGYFDSVELEVAMVNEMYIDNEFAISGMFKHLDSSYMYWTKEDAGCLIPGDSRSVVPLTWRPSDLNYDNQEFELGEYQGFVYMEDASSAYCMEAEGTDNMEPKLIRKMSSVDRSEVRFDVLSQLEIYLPEELGDWSVSLNGGDGPWDRFDPRETNMVSIYEPDHDIWIRRESREGLGEVSWEGLIGYWPMNEASWADGSWVKDISGNDNHGVVRGDLDTDISLLERAGRFYGTGDRINLGIPAAFTNMAVGDFSIEMWIKTTDTGRSRLFSSSDGDTGYSFEISDSHGGALRTFLNGEDHVDDVSVVDGKWHHVVTVRDTGNKVRMYIDGVISYSGSTSVAGFGSSHRTIIGSDPEGWKDHFDGSMDEVRVYDRALTEEEIRSSSTSMDNSLIGHWDLDEGSGSTAHDRSGDGNDEILLVPPNGTAADGPAWTVGRKGPGMGFDGIDDVVASGTYQEFLDLSGKSLSVSVWFRWDGDVGNRSEYVVYNIMGLYTAAVRNGHFQYTFAPGSDWYGGNSFPVTEGKWHHAVLTYDGSRHILYRDGWPIYSSDLAMNVGPTKMLLIGAGMVNGSWDTWDSSLGSYFNGTVDELRIHDRELPAYDIISYHAEMRAENPDEEEVADRLGLMGYWQMDEESWTGAAGEVADSSGFNNHGKSGDGATTETSPLGRAGSFDGEADRVTIVDDENVRESIELEGALTYEAWVYVRGNASDRCGIMGRGIGYDSSSGYGPDYTNSVLYLLKDGSGQYRLRFEMSNGTDVTGVNDTANFTMMSWHHVAVTWDGTTNPNGLKMYVDGELTNETASSILSIQDASKFSNLFELGTMGGGEWYEYSLDGLLDDARVYNRALSPEEIGRHSQAINESLVGCWRFDEKVMLRSQLAHDSSGHDSHGQLGSHPDGDDNDPAWTTAGWIGNALHFDGVDDQVDCGNDTRLNPSGGSFSVSVWFKGYSRNGTNVLYSKGELIKAAVIDGHFQYYWEPEARWYGGRTFPVQRGRCYHAAVVYHGSNQTVYANGVPVFSRMPGGNHTGLADGNEERFLIGAARNSTGQWNYFNGTIDEVRIYQHALSPDEVAEYYNESIVESALLNRTAFRIRYYADAGNDLYVVYNTTRWDNGLHNHAVLKLPGDGTYLDRNHLNAEFWEAGTILKIAQEPKLVISGRQYYGDARDSSYDGHNTVYLGWGDRVTYDVILNEANFYGMYFTLHGETGSAEFPVHVDLSYYTGDRADTDDYGLRGWLSHNESQDIGFKQGTWDTRALKMRLTPPGRYRITLVARSVPVHIRRLIINPALEFDIPDLYAPVSLGGGEENDTEAEDEGGDNPFNCIGIDMGIRPRGIPDDIWDAMYATVQFPVFQALLDGSGPHISVAFGEYVGVDFKWKVTFDKRTGLFASAMVGIELKIVVPLKQTGIKVIAKVGAEVLYVHNESQKDIHKRFDWKVFLSVEVDIPIFKWIIGVPLCYEVANPHNKDQKLLRLEAECYIVIKAVFRLSSKLGEDRITFALAPFTLGQLVTVKVKVTLDLKSLVKGLEKSKAETEKRNKELEEKSENLEKEKEDLEKKMSDEREQIKKDNPEKSDKEVEKTADKRLENLSKKLDKVNIKIKDSDKEKMKEKSIAAHITDYAAWFTKMALKIPSWLLVKIEITIELKFSIGIFYNFAYQTPNKFLMYYERGFEFVFKISFDLWLLEVGFEFKLVLDWVLWYNKVSIPIGPWEDTYIEVGTIKWSNFKDHLKEGDVNGKLRDAVNTKLKAKYKTPTNQKLCWSPELSQPTQNEALENLDFMPLHPETARDVGEALAEEITEEVAKLLFPYPPEFDSWWKLDDRFIKFDLCPLFFRDLDGKGWGREYLLLVDESEDTITIYAPWDDDGPFGCVPLKLWPPWPPFPDANDLKETISPVPIVCYFSDSSYLYFSAGVSALFWEKSVSFKITFGGEVTVAIT